MKNKIIYAVTIVLALLYIIVGHYVATKDLKTFNEKSPTNVVTAQVTKVLTSAKAKDAKQIKFESQLLSGANQGANVTTVYNSLPNAKVKTDIAIGDKILLLPSKQNANNWEYVSHVRSDILAWLFAIFALAVIIFASIKGLNTILSMIFCISSIFIVFVPAILSGQNIYSWTFSTCVFIIVMNLLLVNGANKKTLATILGCISGVIVASIIFTLADHFLALTGFVDEDSMYLLLLNPNNPIDLKGIVFSAIIIGALGAIMDVAMDIASALNELVENTDKPTRKTLIKVGNNIGRDILGMMSNTLVLAYIGGSLTIVLLFFAYNHSLLYLLNKEMVVTEILQAIVGSFGILFTIPFTSWICSILYCKQAPKRKLRLIEKN